MYIISYDLGTGGVKAALYTETLTTVCKCFIEYPMFFPKPGYREQRPDTWWDAIIQSTRLLLSKTNVSPSKVKALSISGQSLTGIPIDKDGNSLLDQVPIWSDQRATEEVSFFFNSIDEKQWYLTTGNGFPAPCYTIFKLMWLKKHFPDIFSKTAYILGSKDYINYKMTGNIVTDHSYASGTGGYNLHKHNYEKKFWDVAEIPLELLPPIQNSESIVGSLLPSVAQELGLSSKTLVIAGGVDNSCMALGCTGIRDGASYISLGSSSWVPVTSSKPVLDYLTKPYVFAHIEPNMYTSAYSIFSGGSSLRWVRDTLFSDITDNPYQTIDQYAKTSPVGANGVFFNPTLAGGTSQDKSTHIQGGFVGLSLSTTRSDLARSVLEGITMNLKQSMDFLSKQVALDDTVLICGGGSKSPFWLQLFSDILNRNVVKTNIDQDTASLGAAAIAAKALGFIDSYDIIPSLHKIESSYTPQQSNVLLYEKLCLRFNQLSDMLSDFGDTLFQ